MKLLLRHKQSLWLSAVFAAFSPALPAAVTLDTNRIREIAAMLPARAAGFGQPITNRPAWDQAAARNPDLRHLIDRAAKQAAQPLPAQPDSLFLEFSQNGNRDRWQKVAFARRERIGIFTLAECLENQGRFLAPLEQTIAALGAERTWVLPAHDRELKNFHGETTDIDLGASLLGAELATAHYLLGNRLSPGSRKLIRENLERRVFAPYRAAAGGSRKEFWWMRGANNWNAVCLNGVTGAALATLDSAEERAWFIVLAETNIGDYLAGGFTPDGYCVEGLGYWNYGFGNFALLAENIRQATGGKIDLLTDSRAAPPALFGVRSEICNGIYLTIADCHPGDKPSGPLMDYLDRRLGLELAAGREMKSGGGLYERAAMAFLPPHLPPLHPGTNLAGLAWRSWFPDSGVLICRPGPAAKTPFAAAIKGGNNGVSHGHNDVGSFSVVAGKAMVICDPGGEVYTARTFGPHRYDSKVLNSFGHAVPVVAGQLQRTGAAAQAVVLARDFTEAADMIRFNLRSAYAGPDLRKLERTFVFKRGEAPTLEVRDEIAFGAPESFETALVTWGAIRRISDNVLEIADGENAVRVAIDMQGRAFHLQQETIDENVQSGRQPVRLGIALDAKISAATVTLRISPVNR
jgi:hypothetical protein